MTIRIMPENGEQFGFPKSITIDSDLLHGGLNLHYLCLALGYDSSNGVDFSVELIEIIHNATPSTYVMHTNTEEE